MIWSSALLPDAYHKNSPRQLNTSPRLSVTLSLDLGLESSRVTPMSSRVAPFVGSTSRPEHRRALTVSESRSSRLDSAMRISKFSYRDFAAWGRRCSLSCTSSSQETPSTSQQTHSVNNRTASYNLYLYNDVSLALALDPARDCRVVRFQTALAEQLFDIAEGERVPKVPAHGAQNQLGRRWSPLGDHRSDCLLHHLFRLPAAAGHSCNTTVSTAHSTPSVTPSRTPGS